MEQPIQTLYDLFHRTLDCNTYMLEEELKQCYELKHECIDYLQEHKHDRSVNRNQYQQVKTTYNYLNRRLNEYEDLRQRGMLLAHFEEIQPNEFMRIDSNGMEMKWD